MNSLKTINRPLKPAAGRLEGFTGWFAGTGFRRSFVICRRYDRFLRLYWFRFSVGKTRFRGFTSWFYRFTVE